MITTPQNPIKAALAAGQVQRGIFLALGSETVTEIAGRAGLDYCLVDGEHAPFDPVLARRQLTVLDAAGCPSAMRVPVGEDWVLKQALDIGAQTIMVPMIDTVAQAEAAARAVHYPPVGRRGMGGATMRAGGYGGNPTYPAEANAQICLVVQVESGEALENVEAIAAVDGVDCCFIGPADLGSDLGYRDNLDDDALWAKISEAVRRIVGAGCAAGVFTPLHREAEMRDAGATMLAVGSDSGLMTQALRSLG